jgi:hypothetical protein
VVGPRHVVDEAVVDGSRAGTEPLEQHDGVTHDRGDDLALELSDRVRVSRTRRVDRDVLGQSESVSELGDLDDQVALAGLA